MRESNISEVLEVGCGTGSLLFEFLDKTNSYTAFEISDKSIDYIKTKLNNNQLTKVIFKNQSAHDVNEYQKYSFIVINSVIQYFPSINYLLDVIKKLVSAAKPGGTIIIGDVRALELLDLYLLEKYRNNLNPKHNNIDHFFYKMRETEILLSPNFFYSLIDLIPEISHVDISIKHGSYENELNYFRYDAVLYINKVIHHDHPLVINYNGHTFETLREKTQANYESPIIISNIPNLYTQSITNKLRDIFPSYVKDYLGAFRETETDNLENINKIINYEFNNYEKIIIYDQHSPLSALQVHLYPQRFDKKIRCNPLKKYSNFRNFYREPFNPWMQKICIDKIKSHLTNHLSSWTTPSVYIWTERWPITNNGKLDKNRLALPILMNLETQHNENKFLMTLIEMWEKITGSGILINNDFWEQGISSLYAHYFLSFINEQFMVEITYKDLRQHNTIHKLSNHIETIMMQNSIL